MSIDCIPGISYLGPPFLSLRPLLWSGLHGLLPGCWSHFNCLSSSHLQFCPPHGSQRDWPLHTPDPHPLASLHRTWSRICKLAYRAPQDWSLPNLICQVRPIFPTTKLSWCLLQAAFPDPSVVNSAVLEFITESFSGWEGMTSDVCSLDGESFQSRGHVCSASLPAGTLHQTWPCLPCTLHQAWPCQCAVSSYWLKVSVNSLGKARSSRANGRRFWFLILSELHPSQPDPSSDLTWVWVCPCFRA